jgi:AcrR family transcriptional regulator
MARWEPNARDRLVEAALLLYGEDGFEQTTVAEIAKQAGLTERTFFRYFADKPEVLFWGAGALQDGIIALVAAAPDDAPPMEAVMSALEGAASFFEERREFSTRRQNVINANADLRGREVIKLASLATAVADELRRRGVTPTTASLAAEAGIAIFKTAFERWIVEPDQHDFAKLIRESLDELKSVTANA